MENNDLHNKLLDFFTAREQSLNGDNQTCFHALRSKAAENFRALGFPTIRVEDWKYTNIIPLIKHDYLLPSENTIQRGELPAIPDFIPQNTVKILLLNGIFSPSFSLPDGVPDDVQVSSLHEVNPQNENLFGEILPFDKNAFTALNTAFFQSGVSLKIVAGKKILQPIAIINYTDARSSSVLVQPRIYISVGKNSEVSIIEYSAALGDSPALVNSAAELLLEENSSLQHYIIQDDSAAKISDSRVRQLADSRYEAVTLTFGGAFVRNTSSAELVGSNAETHFYGLVLGNDRRLIDNHTTVDHVSPHCQSSELYKHILDDKSTAVFNGRVMVFKNAQKTNAYQSNRTILLSAGATINSKPELEIYADDVKCSHGATSGYLDEESLFYLQSRGIPEEKAKALLLHAFASEILNKIKNEEMRIALDRIIADQLHVEE